MRTRWLQLKSSLGLLGLVAALGACDSSALLTPLQITFTKLQVVGATPVRQVAVKDGVPIWRPACNPADGEPQGIRIAMNLQSGLLEGDQDRQIRPGEDAISNSIVGLGTTVAASNFTLTASKITEISPSTDGGASSPPFETVEPRLEFIDHLQGLGRHTPVGLAILIDQSGSTSGLVDKDTCREGVDGTFDPPTNTEFCASDFGNLRLSQAKTLIEQMNPEDPVIVFAFNEDPTEEDCRIVCDIPKVDESDKDREQNCYGTRRDYVLGDPKDSSTIPPLDTLQSNKRGRSNLWSCYQKVWRFMADETDPARRQAIKHIVVLTDGPDTCSTASESYQHCYKFNQVSEDPNGQPGCAGSVGYAEVRAEVEASLASDAAPHIHSSFIHFESRGYPGVDPRMQEMACLTGGHYQFLNFVSMAENANGRAQAFDAAIGKLRLTFGGYWSYLVTTDPFVGDPASANTNLKRGSVYAIDGFLAMLAPKLRPSEVRADFPQASSQVVGLDERLPIRKACTKDADCGPGAGTACGVRCSPETRTCIPPAPSTPCADGTGVCCNGTCVAGETICKDGTAGTPGAPGNCP